jgi:hypothetical protein
MLVDSSDALDVSPYVKAHQKMTQRPTVADLSPSVSKAIQRLAAQSINSQIGRAKSEVSDRPSKAARHISGA